MIGFNRLEIKEEKLIGYCLIEGKERENLVMPFNKVEGKQLIQFNEMTEEFLHDFIRILNDSFKK